MELHLWTGQQGRLIHALLVFAVCGNQSFLLSATLYIPSTIADICYRFFLFSFGVRL